MGFDIANDSTQETAFIVNVVGVTIAVVATMLRFVATKRAGRKPNWEEWFAVLSTFFYILYAIALFYILVTLNGKHSDELSEEDGIKMLKAGYTMSPQFCLQQLFAKLSLLLLYYRLFNVNRAFVRWIWFLGTVQLLWSIATFIVHFFECTPVAKFWDAELPGHCINNSAFLAAGEVPNCLVDFALVGLAVWMVQRLQMRTSTKAKLSILFVIGGLAGIIGFIKIGEGFTIVSSHNLDSEMLDPIWATIQQALSVVCCCAPIYKPLLPEPGLFHKLRSYGSRVFQLQRTSKSSKKLPSRELGASDSIAFKHDTNWIQLDEGSPRRLSLSQSPSEVDMGRKEVV